MFPAVAKPSVYVLFGEWAIARAELLIKQFSDFFRRARSLDLVQGPPHVFVELGIRVLRLSHYRSRAQGGCRSHDQLTLLLEAREETSDGFLPGFRTLAPPFGLGAQEFVVGHRENLSRVRLESCASELSFVIWMIDKRFVIFP